MLNQKGVTLIELTVATAIFSVIVLIVGGVYGQVIESQRSAVAAQNVQENLRFLFEMMSKEMRLAKGGDDASACPGSSDTGFTTYNINNTVSGSDQFGTELYFENKDDECVIYSLENGRLKISREPGGGPLTELVVTPDEITITGMQFYIADYDPLDTLPGSKFQPRATIRLTAEKAGAGLKHKQKMEMQTTVSSRSY